MDPDAPSLVAGHGRSTLLTADGEVLVLTPDELRTVLGQLPPPLVVHAPATFRRAGIASLPCLDLLELLLFAWPAQTPAPTPAGLAALFGYGPPPSAASAASLLRPIASRLLARLGERGRAGLEKATAGLAARMGVAGWPWSASVAAALDQPGATPSADALRVWRKLPRWEDAAPVPPPSAFPVGAAEARRRLAALLGPAAEARPGQADFADAAVAAFAPREEPGAPHVVLGEAGTGVGKTLAYVAPASLWAEKNGGPVWISTYTRHLQRQVEAELARLYPDPEERRRRAIVRKGRENYLCLLNLEERVQAALGGAAQGAAAAQLVPLALVARWALATGSGDVTGGDLPGWVADLFGPGLLGALADRRGECIHGACPHYRACFVEHTARRAREAELVIANHALVLAQAAWGGLDEDATPTRYVFDEGHALFDAADGAFAAELSGAGMAELRRWLAGGGEGRARSRAGLRRRLEDLVARWPQLEAPLDAALLAASTLPALWAGAALPPPVGGGGGDLAEPTPPDAAPALLAALRYQAEARCGEDAGYARTAECDAFPLGPGVAEAAGALRRTLSRIAEPLATLDQRLASLLEQEAEHLDEDVRTRIGATRRTLRRRALDRLAAWDELLATLLGPPPDPGARPEHVLFVQLRQSGRAGFLPGLATARDVALRRHWLDPAVPLALTLAGPAHGILVASATLRDGGIADAEAAWQEAEARVGASLLPRPALRVSVASPFDYAAQARVLLVSDVGTAAEEVAGAYRALFEAARGGALGLFTAIGRLLDVHARIAPALERAGLPLLAQHADAMGNASLVDAFRAEPDSCLLGTDAMRDGVDVPGRALRLVVFDKVPWPRPDILHRERRLHLSGGNPRGYDDRAARLRLRQAFGRLIRSAGDRGAFVLLDKRMPTRLLGAFPAGVPIRRTGLADAVRTVREFLSEEAEAAGRHRPAPSTRAEGAAGGQGAP